MTREAPLPQNSAESAQWLETQQHWASLGVRQFVLDFGHVASTEPVLRFAEEVIWPVRGVRLWGFSWTPPARFATTQPAEWNERRAAASGATLVD